MGIPEGAIIETSNFIGFMMEQCIARGFDRMLLIGHMGKLVKVASGSFHTYNRNSDGRMETMAAYAAMNGASPAVVKEIMDCNTTDALPSLSTGSIWIWCMVRWPNGPRCVRSVTFSVKRRWVLFLPPWTAPSRP